MIARKLETTVAAEIAVHRVSQAKLYARIVGWNDSQEEALFRTGTLGTSDVLAALKSLAGDRVSCGEVL